MSVTFSPGKFRKSAESALASGRPSWKARLSLVRMLRALLASALASTPHCGASALLLPPTPAPFACALAACSRPLFAKARGAAPTASMQSEFGDAMQGGPRAWSEGSLNDFVFDLCFFDLADIDEQPATGDALVEQLRTGPIVSSFDPTELALAGCDRFPSVYAMCHVAAWPGTNEPKEDVITEFGWARAKAAADDAWRSAAAEAVDLGIRKALLVCQDELDDAASDAWGIATWRPLLYLADAVGIEEEFIRSVRSYVLGTRPAGGPREWSEGTQGWEA